MADPKLYEIAEKMGWSRADLDAFLDNHKKFSLTKNAIEVAGPNGTVEKIYPNWPLYHKFVDHVAGKPAVSEPKPQSVDPFKEIAADQLPTDEETNLLLAPKKSLGPPPEEA